MSTMQPMIDEPAEQQTCTRCGNAQPVGLDHCTNCGRPILARPRGWHPRTWWGWSRWFVLHKVLHVEDTPHRIALGLALGMFTAFTPTVGVQMALTFALAWLLGANKVVGLPLAWITNPVTMAPIFYFNYRVGSLLVGGRPMRMKDFVLKEGGGWLEQMQNWWQIMVNVFWQCWLGSVIIGAVLGAATYFLSYYGIAAFRARHRQRFPGSPA